MAVWFYQLDNTDWSANNYRLDVWEGARWEWPVGRATGLANPPVPGDMVVFFFAPAGCDEPGFYGWAVMTQWIDHDGDRRFYFLPVSPSDRLKMHPWWDDEAKGIADAVRGKVKQGTLWPVPLPLARQIGAGINAWLSGADHRQSPTGP